MYIHTNLADSVVFAKFKGHQYALYSELYEKELENLLEELNERNDMVLVMTWNQIADNRFLLLSGIPDSKSTEYFCNEFIAKLRDKIQDWNEINNENEKERLIRNLVEETSKELEEWNAKPSDKFIKDSTEQINEVSKKFNESLDEQLINKLAKTFVRQLIIDRQIQHFKLLKQLVKDAKIKFSTFNDYNLVTYTLNVALVKCLKRLSEGETSPEDVYISSLFWELGEDNNELKSRSRLELLLGYDLSGLKYHKEKKYFAVNGNTITFDYFIEKSTENNKYGLYTALKKYYENPNCSDWLVPWNMPVFNSTLKVELIINWIKNIVELNAIAEEHEAIIPNARTDISLSDILSALLNNDKLLNEKLDFWLNRTQHKDKVKKGIIEVLKELSKYSSTRTAMYIKIKDCMNHVAEQHKDDQDLYRKFCTITRHDTTKLPYRRQLFVIMNIIDYSYNLLTLFFSLPEKECVLLEGFKSFKTEGGAFVYDKGIDKLKKAYSKYTLNGEKIFDLEREEITL